MYCGHMVEKIPSKTIDNCGTGMSSDSKLVRVHGGCAKGIIKLSFLARDGGQEVAKYSLIERKDSS